MYAPILLRYFASSLFYVFIVTLPRNDHNRCLCFVIYKRWWKKKLPESDLPTLHDYNVIVRYDIRLWINMILYMFKHMFIYIYIYVIYEHEYRYL